MLSQLESFFVLSLTICSLLSFFLFFLLSPLFSFSNKLHSPLSLIAKQPLFKVRDRERLRSAAEMLSQLESSSVMSLTICSLLSFFLFFLLSPLLSFSNNLHSPFSLIGKQTLLEVRDRERLRSAAEMLSQLESSSVMSLTFFSLLSFFLFFLHSDKFENQTRAETLLIKDQRR